MKIKGAKGNEKILLNTKDIAKQTRRGIRQGFFQLGSELKKTANRQILKKPKSGRTYLIRRGKTRRRHVASAAGESPANISGEYRRSINFKLIGSTKLIFGAGNSDVPYADFLETGTKNMESRPGLGNAVKSVQRNARRYFSSNIEKFIKK